MESIKQEIGYRVKGGGTQYPEKKNAIEIFKCLLLVAD